MAIERIDNNRGYSKQNCRWATPKEQARNRRKNILVIFNGKSVSISVVAEQINMPYQMLWQRIRKHGWSIEDAVSIPKYHKHNKA